MAKITKKSSKNVLIKIPLLNLFKWEWDNLGDISNTAKVLNSLLGEKTHLENWEMICLTKLGMLIALYPHFLNKWSFLGENMCVCWKGKISHASIRTIFHVFSDLLQPPAECNLKVSHRWHGSGPHLFENLPKKYQCHAFLCILIYLMLLIDSLYINIQLPPKT